jgi:glycosyltransferase involved in cell wall biosynthesis
LSTPEISIVIPVYNTQDYLRECLDSVVAQTFADFEVICVNDGSTDGSLDILREYADRDKRFAVLTQKNKGAGAARNYGMSKASGNYIIFLDSDDWFENALLEKLHDRIEETRADFTVCEAYRYHVGQKAYTENYEPKNPEILQKKKTVSRHDFPEGFFDLISSVPFTKLYRHSFLAEQGILFQETLRVNDELFFITTMALAKKIGFVLEPLLTYRTGVPSSSVGTLFDTHPYDFFRALLAGKQKLMECGIYLETERSHINHVANKCMRVITKSIPSTSDSGLHDAINLLKNRYMEPLGIADKPREYFYYDTTAEAVLALQSMSVEDFLAWIKQHGSIQEFT